MENTEAALMLFDAIEGQSRDMQLAIACRAALRAYPHANLGLSGSFYGTDKFILPSARCLITTVTSMQSGDLVVLKALREAAGSLSGKAICKDEPSFLAAQAILKSESVSATEVVKTVLIELSSLANARMSMTADLGYFKGEVGYHTAYFEVVKQCYRDAKLSPESIFLAPLWHEKTGETPSDFSPRSQSAKYEDDPEWSFWREWYQGFLDGKPMDWELQRRVALIEDPIWEAGSEAVAEEIERIREAYVVEVQAAELKELLAQVREVKRGIGDNNPPSAIDDPGVSAEGVEIIWNALDDLEGQAQSSSPSKVRVQKAVGVLLSAMKAAGVWSGKKVDRVIDGLIDSTVKYAGPALLAWVAGVSEPLGKLIEAGLKWLLLL